MITRGAWPDKFGSEGIRSTPDVVKLMFAQCNFGLVSADVFAGGQCGRTDRSQLENVLLGSLCDRVEHSPIARLGTPTKKEEPLRTLPRQEAWDKWCQAAVGPKESPTSPGGQGFDHWPMYLP